MATELPTIDQGGRPVEFCLEQRERLLDLLAGGLGNDRACREVGICRATLYRALSRDLEFRERYDSAKCAAVDALVDEAEELAEKALHAATGAEVAGIGLAVKFLWWKAGRLAPRRWGEKANLHVRQLTITDNRELAKRTAFLEALKT